MDYKYQLTNHRGIINRIKHGPKTHVCWYMHRYIQINCIQHRSERHLLTGKKKRRQKPAPSWQVPQRHLHRSQAGARGDAQHRAVWHLAWDLQKSLVENHIFLLERPLKRSETMWNIVKHWKSTANWDFNGNNSMNTGGELWSAMIRFLGILNPWVWTEHEIRRGKLAYTLHRKPLAGTRFLQDVVYWTMKQSRSPAVCFTLLFVNATVI